MLSVYLILHFIESADRGLGLLVSVCARGALIVRAGGLVVG